MNRRRWTACLLLLPFLLAAAGCGMDDLFFDDEGYGSGMPPYVGGPVVRQNGAYGDPNGGRVIPAGMQTAEPPR